MASIEKKIGVKAWPKSDRPREKLLAKGTRLLSDAELIAVIINTGSTSETAIDVSKRILSFYGDNLILLAQASIKELCKFRGVGIAKSIAIAASLELGRRRKETMMVKPRKITSSKDVNALMRLELGDLHHEEFWVLLLNRAHFIIATKMISKGGLSGTAVDPKLIFKLAIDQHAAAMILVHNHPSGNLKPSESDLILTNKMVASGEMLELPILDHLILTDGSFMSMADEGLIKRS